MKRRNLDEEVYDILLQQIMEGIYSMGEKIRVEELAEELDVSVTPVLSALRKLVYFGLVTTKRGNGFCVATFTKQEQRELLQAHDEVFMLAFRKIIEQDDHVLIQRLRTLSDQAMAAYQSQKYKTYLKADNLFHNTILEQLDNRYLIQFCHEMFQKLCFCYQLNIASDSRGMKTARPENHYRFCDALEQKDYEALRQTLHADFDEISGN